jgi:hypothetical protein
MIYTRNKQRQNYIEVGSVALNNSILIWGSDVSKESDKEKVWAWREVYLYGEHSTVRAEAELQQPHLFELQKEPETMNALTDRHTNDISKWNTKFFETYFTNNHLSNPALPTKKV